MTDNSSQAFVELSFQDTAATSPSRRPAARYPGGTPGLPGDRSRRIPSSVSSNPDLDNDSRTGVTDSGPDAVFGGSDDPETDPESLARRPLMPRRQRRDSSAGGIQTAQLKIVGGGNSMVVS